MKKIACTLLFFVFFISASFAQVYTGLSADNFVKGAEKVVIAPNLYIPTFIKFRQGSELNLDEWQLWLKKNYKFSSALGFKLIRSEPDQIGMIHYRYQETYNNIPIYDGIWILHSLNSKIVSMNGKVFNQLEINSQSQITEAQALVYGLNHVNALKYKWQVPEEETNIKEVNKDPNATYYPKGELFMVPEDGKFGSQNYRMAFRFDIYAHKPMSRAYIFVDAINGKILLSLDRIYVANVSATADTKYSGTRTIMTDYTGSTYRLRETGRGNGIETYNMQLGTTYTNTDFTNATTTWTGTNANHDEVARDAHWGAEKTWDFYYNTFNRNSVDNAGLKLLSYVHANLVGMGYGSNVNAFWDGTRMTYGDGDATYSPLTTIDICGHEITHGVTQNTANLTYSNESGAMNEGFSDIFGTCIEFYAKPPLATGNWTIGEQIGAPFRSMSNPNAYSQPDTYNGTYWYTGTADNGGVHTNSGVLNYWFYLLCQGGSGTNDIGNAFNVTGITMTKAEQIAYRTLTVYLTASSTYSDARTAAIQASSDLYGGCSQETISTTNAWYAVGVGAAYSSTTTTANFSACPTTQCTNAPFTVQFNNLSVNGNTYTWYFGDGGTSTLASPSHTYTANGAYNVKLVAVGGTCGSDSITKNAYITVGPAYPCAASIPATGTGTVQTSCTGYLYDSGLCSDYANNTDGNITISPTGATSVTLTFSSFSFESGYDYLYIYNGPTTASPQVTGSPFSGTTLPGPITSTGGSITIRQTSDAGVVASGFALAWTCASSNQPPVANFSANNTTSCSGTINFTDLSTNGPTSWLWDFGDGQTSTSQNPSHTYTSSGTFTVTLTSTNPYGNDQEIKSNYIIITMPTAPTTTGASRCGTGTLTLTASGSGTLKWYDALTGGNLVNTGTSFTTPSLSTTTNYYVQDSITGATHHCAKTDNTGGGAYTSTGDHYQIFDCTTATTLISVKIYGNTPAPGNKTVELRSSAGTVLQSTTVNVLAGLNTYTLNFNIPVGTALRLACTDGTNLYRNNGTMAYPYTTAGFISVTGSSAGAAYYYYFYDWIIAEPGCNSPRSIVTATINSTSVTPTSVTATPTNVCSGSPTILSATGGSGNTLNWMTGSCGGTSVGTGNNLSVSPTVNTTYYARWENACGNSTCQNVAVTVSPAPIAPTSVSASATTICAGSSTTLTATGGSGTTLRWLSGSCGGTSAGTGNNLVVTPAVTTTYYARYENTCGNSACQSVTITVNSLPVAPTLLTASDTNICAGDNTILNESGGSGGSLIWTTGSCGGAFVDYGHNVPVSPTVSTTYYAHWSNSCGNSTCLSINITVSPAPIAPTSASATLTTICAGQSTILSATGGSGTTLSWHNGSCNGTIEGSGNNLSVSPNNTTTYYCRWENTCGASTCQSVTVTYNPAAIASISTSDPTDFCFGSPISCLMTAQTGAGYSYQWQLNGADISAANASSYTSTQTGDFTCVVTNLCGDVTSNTIAVTTNTLAPSASITPSGSTVFCTGDSVVLNGTTGIGYSYQWQLDGVDISGAIGSSYIASVGGNYTVIVSNGCGSDASSPVTVIVNTSISASINPSGALAFCDGNSVLLNAVPGSGYNYQWQLDGTDIPGATSSVYNANLNGDYTVVLTYGGCSGTSVPITVTVYPLPSTPVITQGNDTLYSSAPTGNQWYFHNILGDIMISGATDSYYVPPTDGYYYVIVNDINGCVSDTSNLIYINLTSITENNTSDFNIYPNPNNGSFVIQMSTAIPNTNMSIVDMLGKVVYMKQLGNDLNQNFSLNLAEGLYYVRLQNQHLSLMKKIVINK
jgi:Zn-dependent metalloprotease